MFAAVPKQSSLTMLTGYDSYNYVEFVKDLHGGVSFNLWVFFNYSGTIVARILYYTSNESVFSSLSHDFVIRRFR